MPSKRMHVWFSSWAFLLALGWLLPNHYRPWTAFHNEVWVAFFSLLPGLALIRRFHERDACDFLCCLIFVFLPIPIFQWIFGLVPYFGSALLFVLYLLGFLLAYRIGRQWECLHSGWLVDFLFLSIGLASFFSVYLQLSQSLEIENLGIWMVPAGPRPAANLAQPNNMATLLCLGMLSVLWAMVRGFVAKRYAFFGLCLLGGGVTLTASRTGALSLIAVVILMFRLRCILQPGIQLSKKQVLTVLVCSMLFSIFAGALLDLSLVAERIRTDLRLVVWPAFFDAILQRPWFGYGVGESAKAQLLMAHEHPPTFVVFGSAHNFALDLFVWFGVPLGLLSVAGLVYWLFTIFFQVKGAEGLVLKGVLVVVGIHSMTEFPLQYAYFLMPVGILVGALASRANGRPLFFISRRWVLFHMAVVSMLAALVVRDYLHVEEDYRVLRSEWAGLSSGRYVTASPMIILDQWEKAFKFARFDTSIYVDDVGVRDAEAIVFHFHSPIYFKKLIEILIGRGDIKGASRWSDIACSVVVPRQCLELRSVGADNADRLPPRPRDFLVLPSASSE